MRDGTVRETLGGHSFASDTGCAFLVTKQKRFSVDTAGPNRIVAAGAVIVVLLKLHVEVAEVKVG